MKTLVLIVLLLIPFNLFAPNMTINYGALIIKMENELLINNLLKLKDNTTKTRGEVFNLVQPLIEIYMKRKEYNNVFCMDSASYAIACIFVSESSNYKGHSAKSRLWLEHNNPFGLTSGQGVTYKSWEMIEGKRVNMNRTFKTFTSLEEAIDSLMNDYLSKPSFNRVLNSHSVKDFLYNLYKCGYMSNNHWPNFAFNQIYLKCLKEQ